MAVAPGQANGREPGLPELRAPGVPDDGRTDYDPPVEQPLLELLASRSDDAAVALAAGRLGPAAERPARTGAPARAVRLEQVADLEEEAAGEERSS